MRFHPLHLQEILCMYPQYPLPTDQSFRYVPGLRMRKRWCRSKKKKQGTVRLECVSLLTYFRLIYISQYCIIWVVKTGAIFQHSNFEMNRRAEWMVLILTHSHSHILIGCIWKLLSGGKNPVHPHVPNHKLLGFLDDFWVNPWKLSRVSHTWETAWSLQRGIERLRKNWVAARSTSHPHRACKWTWRQTTDQLLISTEKAGKGFQPFVKAVPWITTLLSSVLNSPWYQRVNKNKTSWWPVGSWFITPSN